MDHRALQLVQQGDKQEYVEVTQHHLIQDVTTRWNSIYFMLERLGEQQRDFYKVVRLAETGVEAPLNNAQWDMMSHVMFILKTFKNATGAHWAMSSLLSGFLGH